MTEILLKPDYVVLGGDAPSIKAGVGVLVGNDRISAIASPEVLQDMAPAARKIDLTGQVLMPGLVNAHQHGRGITALQLGFEDDHLEPWMAGKRRRQQIDPYLQTLYAALQMIANGVTSAVHANTVGGGPDYSTDVNAALQAYDDAGLRVMFGVGAMDRAELAYPPADQDAVFAGLPEGLQTSLGNITRPVYCAGADATIALMAQLRGRYTNNARIRFAYAPAGPQWVTDALLSSLAEDARKNALPIHMHVLESPSQVDAVNACYPRGLMRHLEQLGVLGPLTSFAHAVWLSAEDVALVIHHGCTLVRNPASNLRLHAGIAPLAHYISAGAKVALGSDNTTLNDDEDLFTEARLARALSRNPVWEGPEPVSVDALWAMMNVNGARAMGLADEIGEIAPGRIADMIALDLGHVRKPYLDPDLDLLAAILGRARGADVRMTMIGGDILYRDGQFVHHDIRALAERCRRDGERSKAEPATLTSAQAETLNVHLRAHYKAQRAQRPKSPEAGLLASEKGWARS